MRTPVPVMSPPTPHEPGDRIVETWLKVSTMPSTTLVGVTTTRIRQWPPSVRSHPVPFHVIVPVIPLAVNVASHCAQSEATVMTPETVAVRNVAVIE